MEFQPDVFTLAFRHHLFLVQIRYYYYYYYYYYVICICVFIFKRSFRPNRKLCRLTFPHIESVFLNKHYLCVQG